uniref:Slc25a-22 n=1 Tax=Schmidtea mediterranea TaxID=79327 RepID=A0A0H3YF57_SCHMD|nr:slc25a-22 [Schmidtea mediterranea]
MSDDLIKNCNTGIKKTSNNIEAEKKQDTIITIQTLKNVLKNEHDDANNLNTEKSNESKDIADKSEKFLEFLKSQETQLKLAFKQMDRNHDNKIDSKEIQETMADLGIIIGIKEAEQLLSRVDLDHNLAIDYDEWKTFLLQSSARSLQDIIKYWRKSCAIDIGENMTIPDDFSVQEKMTGIAWKTLVAGGVAGCVSRTTTAPLDRIKVTMQAHGAKVANLGIINTIKSMISEGGVSSLWRGNGVSCFKIGPESAIKFLSYEVYKKFVCRITNNTTGDVTLMERFYAGALAGATSQNLIFPMEVLKTRMTLRKSGQYSSIYDCAKNVYRTEGFQVFFRGYVPNLLGILPYAGIDLALFETFKNIYLKSNNETSQLQIPVYVSLLSGATSSVCGQFATYPLALVRTKLQAIPMVSYQSTVNQFESFAIQSDSQKITMVSVFRSIKKQEGFFGFYRGIGPNTLKVIPAVSISYAVFDQTRHLLGIG